MTQAAVSMVLVTGSRPSNSKTKSVLSWVVLPPEPTCPSWATLMVSENDSSNI